MVVKDYILGQSGRAHDPVQEKRMKNMTWHPQTSIHGCSTRRDHTRLPELL